MTMANENYFKCFPRSMRNLHFLTGELWRNALSSISKMEFQIFIQLVGVVVVYLSFT